jgi:L-2,4-diaminobutyric acid acetyltransferase
VTAEQKANDIQFRTPEARDASPIHTLVGRLDGLEQNTCYAYALLCSHFAATSVVAERHGTIVGFNLGYLPPSRPDAIFVWQIGVAPEARGIGLGTKLLNAMVALPAAADTRYLEATVATGNNASKALFTGFARKRGVACEIGPGYPAELFLPEIHESEDLFRIGPLEG